MTLELSRHPHEPAALRLIVRRTPTGGLCFSTPLTPGWAMVANRPADIPRAIEAAWSEATIAAYARLRGVLYDLAETEETIPAEAYARGRRHPEEEPDPTDRAEHRRRTKHPHTHPPENWVECSDGAMLSPGGQKYGPTTRVASAVRARREQL